MFNPQGTPPRSPRKEGSFFGSSQAQGEYRGHGPVNLKSSSSTSSLVSPSKSRRIRAAVKNLKIRADAAGNSHGSMENVQALSYGLAQSYLNPESMHSPLPSPIHRKPPSLHSALNSRSSSVSSLGSSRDRSLERSGSSPFGNRDYPYHSRDKSLDRQTQMHYRSYNDIDGYNPTGGRERSKDRDYPYMGARSLEREHSSNLHRSKSIDHEYLASQSNYLPNQPEYIHTRETLILDLQSQIADLNKECAIMQQNLDTTKEKLSSSMNSIKTFWSPELKKERTLRKEENLKSVTLAVDLKSARLEKEKLVVQLREAENQLELVRSCQSPDVITPTSQLPTSITHPDPAVNAIKKDRQSKEILLLRKTIDEMELRIETQKQTLTTRDESIKKLLEMLQSKGLSAKQYEDDSVTIDRLTERTLIDERKIQKLENLLEQRDKEISFLAEEVELAKSRARSADYEDPLTKRNSVDVLTLEAMLETKDGKIHHLEAEISRLRRDVTDYRSGGSDDVIDSNLSSPVRHSSFSGGQEMGWPSSDKYLKSKIESLKSDLSRKENEIVRLNTQHESAQTQTADKQQLITVLREQVQAKEQQCTHIQHDLDSLRERLGEKEAQLEVKSRSLLTAHGQHQQVCQQLAQLRDQLDVTEGKTTAAQKRIEQNEELIREKEEHIRTVKSQLTSIQADRSSRHSALDSLQSTISDQTRQIDKLKDKLERREVDHQDEVDLLQATIRELKNKVTSLEAQLSDKQREAAEVKEGNTELHKERLKKESVLKEVREELSRRSQEVKRLEEQCKQMTSLQHGRSELSKELEQLKVMNIDLKKEKVRRDSFIKDLKEELMKKTEQMQSAEQQLKQVQSTHSAEGSEKHKRLSELKTELRDLRREVGQREGEVTRTQTEVDRLLDILRTTENEKNEKDKQIKELHDQIKEYKQKVGNLKKNHQTEKNSQQQVLEEARKCAGEDTTQLKTLLLLKDGRISEMEEALRESVKITAAREMFVHDLDVKVKKAEIHVRTKSLELDALRERCSEAGEEVSQLRESLAERAAQVRELGSERNKYILEAYDMKQEAILAAITEKDAHIAVIEMTPNLPASQTVPEVEKLTQQKHDLQGKLRELTKARMEVLQREEKNQTLVNRARAKQSQEIETTTTTNSKLNDSFS